MIFDYISGPKSGLFFLEQTNKHYKTKHIRNPLFHILLLFFQRKAYENIIKGNNDWRIIRLETKYSNTYTLHETIREILEFTQEPYCIPYDTYYKNDEEKENLKKKVDQNKRKNIEIDIMIQRILFSMQNDHNFISLNAAYGFKTLLITEHFMKYPSINNNSLDIRKVIREEIANAID